VLTAGGTGGHLFPAFALAQELGRRGYEIDLITDMRGHKYGSDFPARQSWRVPAATIAGKNPLSLTKTALKLGAGVIKARSILQRLAPRAIVGFGGYPTFPPIIAAASLGVPAILHEQNAVMGRANRILARKVRALALSFARTKHVEGELAAKSVHTGNPVRDMVIEAARIEYPPLDKEGPFRLLVFGGSQGARYFSDIVPPAIALLPAELQERLRIVQQCRPEDMERVRAAYDAAGAKHEISDFFANLPELIARSHLVIARSGASTIAELAVIGRPSLLVPLPHALDNDQLLNAASLSDAGGAILREQKDLDAKSLADDLTKLMSEPAMLIEAAANARSAGRPEAVELLADLVEKVARGEKA
jgi:UDP-N-acetylglucosamine--N-acetylmuramyl-(pentapeptide) pyrophosphoryl-undecaprenol N-acetylglucosamine transferase